MIANTQQDEEDIRRILSSNSTWLSDAAIDKAQTLLSTQFPHVTGFQNTFILNGSSYGGYAAKDMPFVQIVNIRNSHWICLSNYVSNTCIKGKVNYYDSSSSSIKEGTEIPGIVKKVSAALMFLEGNNSITIQVAKCKQQKGSYDCGLFAIANATALCFGLNPSSCIWKQSKMRTHLARCFKNGKMEMFPYDLCKQRAGDDITFVIDCHCRVPHVKGDPMVQCDRCMTWYHRKCENISSSRWQDLEDFTVAYVCCACQQASR